jgi:hypothetical protein
MRQHRAELLEAGALCFIAGRLYVHSKLFTEVVVEAGQRVLKARHPATRKDTAADA